MRVEIETKQVDETFDSVTKDYQKHAALPGFRPGKAPRAMVLHKYEKDIEAEVKKKLIGDSYRKAIDEKKIDVIGYPDIEEIQFARGQALQFAATIETAPEIQLPEYKGLAITREDKSVTDADVDRAINLLRDRQTNFKKVERALQAGDIAVVNYTGTSDGKPLTELAPTAKGLTEQKNFWIEIKKDSFIPGFSEQLADAKAGDKRTVNVDFPADFVTPQLAGKKGVYEVEVVEVKEKILPPLDDAFAKSFGAESLEKLREGVRKDLENELKHSQEKNLRAQLIRSLLDKVTFDLPESSVAHQTRNVVYDIVRENTQRGVPREVIEKEKEGIYSAAAKTAKEQVKVSFLLQKIAEKEDIKVAQEEILRRVQTLASVYQITPEKFLKDLQKRNGLVEIYDQLANEKVMEFLQNNAKIETVAATAESVPTAEVNPS